MCQGKRRADELHFLSAATRGSPARINRLKDKDVRKKEPGGLQEMMKRGEGGHPVRV